MKKKITALALVVVLVALLLTSMTIAYFTDTENATNVFTVGSIDLDLWEYKADESGVQEPLEEVESNIYENILPGVKYIKNPTVENEGDNDAYVRMLVTVPHDVFLAIAEKAGTLEAVFGGHDSNKWERADILIDEANNTITYVYNYTGYDKTGVLAPNTEPVTLFDSFTLPAGLTQEDLASWESFYINVTAQAIQKEGFDSQSDALAALATEAPVSGVTGVLVESAEELAAALNSGAYVVLTSTVNGDATNNYLRDKESEYMWTVGGTLMGGKIEADEGVDFALSVINEDSWFNTSAAAATVNAVTIETNAGYGVYAQAIHADVTLNKVTINNSWGGGIQADYGGSTVYLNDCTIVAADGTSSAVAYQQVAVAAAGNSNIVINSGDYTGKYAVYVYNSGGTITINGGNFNGELKTDAGEIVIYGGTFTDDPSAYVAPGYTVVHNANGTYTVQ